MRGGGVHLDGDMDDEEDDTEEDTERPADAAAPWGVVRRSHHAAATSPPCQERVPPSAKILRHLKTYARS